MASKLRDFYTLPTEGLSKQEKMTWQVTEFFLRWASNRPILGVDGHEFFYHAYPVNQFSRPQMEMPIYLSESINRLVFLAMSIFPSLCKLFNLKSFTLYIQNVVNFFCVDVDLYPCNSYCINVAIEKRAYSYRKSSE